MKDDKTQKPPYPKELENAVRFAHAAGWKLSVINPRNQVVIIEKKEERTKMNIYWKKDFAKHKTFTVQTILDHPKSGRNQLNRRWVSYEQLIELINQPRQHTGKGYRKKRK